ncbi:UDP-glucuronosyltransferase 2A1-like [Onychostoma macrolepis]|uniref:UDP-glucuronosyltransferase 2A1-like n=1 Tax=Onychostoma macrolepis TaxID=369639 RepID=UPI00272B59C5|nr:UDP-glucuronosyltransferase 2A1-like [Onychostoma macrolepis]
MRLVVCFLSLLTAFGPGKCGNVLVWFTEGSHWINLKIVLETLIDRGHNVTVLVPDASLFMHAKESDRFSYQPFNVSISAQDIEDSFEDFLHFSLYEMEQLNLLQIYIKFYQLFSKDLDLCFAYCDGTLKSRELMDKLQHGKFNVMLSDPIYPCSEALAEKLNIPIVYTLRFSIANTLERMCGQIPAPPSFVPGTMSKLTDKMSFTERIKNMLFYLSQDALAISLWKKVDKYYTEYFVWYTEGSHWLNMRIVLDTLIDRGHSVTVLVPDGALFMKAKESDRFSYQPFNVSTTAQDMQDFLDEFLHFSVYETDQLNLLQIQIKFYKLASKHQDIGLSYCDGILKSPELMDKLRNGKFDVVLSDPMYPCSDIVAEELNVPLVYTFRFSIAHTAERMCGQIPAPPSFVPGAMSKLTDKMSFTERIINMLFYLSQDPFCIIAWKKFDNYYTEYLGRPTSSCEMMGKADIWLIRTYWDFEFPRPFLPNFKYVGGLHCTPAKPLPKDMEEFVQSSGDDGIVVFTLGSMIDKMPKETSNMIASALAQIPQKVLWRYGGEKPDTLGANTKIYKWIPQNDLLGHPKTRAFITHGGTNSIYEAIYHGVPMVGIPLFGDQPDNLVHMKAKGAAVVMENIKTTQPQDLVDGLNAVINDPLYKENAMRLSRIHHDRPIKPLDETVFWIEFVMRNKGAKHLRVEAHNLTWYQYHCLDVFAFLITILTVVLYVFFKMCKFFIMRCCFRSKRKSKKE